MTPPHPLAVTRRAIAHLLDASKAADARASYYAFDHPENRTTIVQHPFSSGHALGYVCLSRTGLDLFRPLLTMRLPWGDMDTSSDLLRSALPAGAAVLMSVPALYMPLTGARFEIQQQSEMAFYALDRGRHEPIVNVLTTRSAGANGLPRFAIRMMVRWRQAPILIGSRAALPRSV